MARVAHCQCGALRASAGGEPDAVVACSCTACQRRTGSVFGVGAYFARSRVTFEGAAREYERKADSGRTVRSFFCPVCGTCLYWLAERDPERVGIAVGAFADAAFPAPDRSVFDSRKHAWVEFGAAMPGFVHGRDSARSR